MRAVVSGVLIAAVAGCGGGAATPTAPTALLPPPSIASSNCTPATSTRVHTIPVPGAPTPVTVWIDGTTPPRGAAVRVGDIAQVSSRYLTPAGFTTTVQAVVGDEFTRGFFASVASVGCGSGTSGTPIPRTDGSLRVWLRVWVTAGTAAQALPALGKTPDYEASELMDWTVVP